MLRFLLYMVFFVALPAAAQQLTFNTYTPADGLTDVRVQKIFQDSRGILYFLTRDGFCSFDGQRFQHFTQYQNQPLSIVNDIAEVKNGRLLISAFSGMYWLQNNQLQKDTSLFNAVKEPGNIISAGPDEWILLSNNGTYLYKAGKVTPLYTTEPGGSATVLQLDKAVCHGPWLIGTSVSASNSIYDELVNHVYQLVLYNRPQQRIVSILRADHPFDMAMYNNSVFIKTNDQWKLINQQELNNGQLRPEPMSLLTTQKADNFFIDKQDYYWLFRKDNTLCRIHAITNDSHCYGSSNGLPASISGIFQDRENNFWFMVAGKGVYKLVQSRIEAFHWPGNTSTNNLQNILQAYDGTISLRTGNTVRTIRNGQYAERNVPVQPGALQVFTLQNKWRILYSNGTLATENGGLIRFANFIPGSKLISSHIRYDSQGRLLTAGDFFSIIAGDTLVASLPLPYFTDNICTDNNDTYWCFARNGGIAAYVLSNKGLAQKIQYTDHSYSTRYSIHWNKDTFCIGTRNNGVVFVKANNSGYQKLFTISTNTGLSNNFISGLLKINDKQLLVATVAGLDRVHFAATDTSVEQLFSRTGLFTGVPAMVRRDDSTVIALTDAGDPYLVHLENDKPNTQSPALFFNRISVNGRTIGPSLENIFTYNQNNFRFSVSAPSFIDEKNIRFVFTVNGENRTAGTDARSGDFELSNLAPGHYTVSITALLPGYTSLHNTITYSFRIKKPFWKTPGFIIAMLVLAALITYIIFNTLLRRKLLRQRIELEKQEAIARERTRIATDMHDDLGAGISTIKYLSQSAPFITPAVQKENNLKIAAQADDLVDKMNDIIWAMNEKNDTLDNLVYYTKAWVANFAEQHTITAAISIPANVPATIIRGEKRQHIFLMIKECVHNIIKHAGASHIWLQLELRDAQLQVTIKDDGRGFDPKKMTSGNGLANIRKRIQAVSGQIHIENNQGTVIHFSVPL